MQFGRNNVTFAAAIAVAMASGETVAGILTGKVTNPNAVGVPNVQVDF